MTETSRSLQAQLDAQPFRRLQWQVVGLCWLVNILDGFDLLGGGFVQNHAVKHSGRAPTWALDLSADTRPFRYTAQVPFLSRWRACL